MVLDPREHRGEAMLRPRTPAQQVEFEKLYATEAENVVAMKPPRPAFENPLASDDSAGVTSETLALQHPAVRTNLFEAGKGTTLTETPAALLEGAAGLRGSPDLYTAASSKLTIPHRPEQAYNVIQQDPSVPESAPGWGIHLTLSLIHI